MFACRQIFVVFAAAWLFFVTGWAHAAQDIGMVIGIKGRVWADSAGNERDLTLKSPVFVDDVIHTGQDGRVQIMFADDTVLAQGPNSRITLDDYVYDPKAESADLLFKMGEGTFRVVTGGIAEKNPEKFKLESPLAVIGIRGTMLASKVQEQNESHYTLDLSKQHVIEVASKTDPTQVSVMRQDTTAVDVTPAAVSAPRRASTQEVQGITEETSVDEGGEGQMGDTDPEAQQMADVKTEDQAPSAAPETAAAEPAATTQEFTSEYEQTSTTQNVEEESGSDGGTGGGTGGYVTDNYIAGAILTEDSSGYTYPSVPPYHTDGFNFINDSYFLFREGLVGAGNDRVEISGTGSAPDKVTYLQYGSDSGSFSQPLTYTKLGAYSGSEEYLAWGYWQTSATFTISSTNYQISRIYDIRGDLNDQTDSSLTGTYSGTASGVYYFDDTAVETGSGTFSCDIDVGAGTVSNFGLSVAFPSGTYSASGGSGSLTANSFEITGWSSQPNTPQGYAATHHYTAGAVFGPDAVGGLWTFQHIESGVDWEGGVGEFHGKK